MVASGGLVARDPPRKTGESRPDAKARGRATRGSGFLGGASHAPTSATRHHETWLKQRQALQVGAQGPCPALRVLMRRPHSSQVDNHLRSQDNHLTWTRANRRRPPPVWLCAAKRWTAKCVMAGAVGCRALLPTRALCDPRCEPLVCWAALRPLLSAPFCSLAELPLSSNDAILLA